MLLKIGTPADYAPFSYKNSITDEYIGFDIDLISHIAKALNLEYEFIKTNWFDLENDLNLNKFDIAVGGISLTDTRLNKFLTSPPIMDDAKTILTSIKHSQEIYKIEDIDKKEYTIIANRGGTNEIFVKNNIKNANIKIVDDNESIFEKIARGDADFMFTDLSEALYREAHNHFLHVAKPITLYTKLIPYGFIYHNQNIKTIIDKALNDYLKTIEFKYLYDKYFTK